MPGTDLIVPAGPLVTVDQPRDELDDAVDAFAASAKSAATRRAYRADGPTYLAWVEEPGYSDTWTSNKADARHFTDRDDAEQIRRGIVLSEGIAVAIVPVTG